MNTCKTCGGQFKTKVLIDGKRISLQRRMNCLKCVPYGSPGWSPNAVKPRHRIINNQAVTTYRQRVKLRSIDYLGGKCWACEYSKCLSALVFHHIDPESKSFGVADGRTRKWETVRTELDKCALLCANCHEEVHFGLIDMDQIISRYKARHDFTEAPAEGLEPSTAPLTAESSAS